MTTYTVLGAILVLTTTGHGALVPKALCVAQCAPTIAAQCLNKHGKVKPACKRRFLRQCRHHKPVCPTTTTSTTTTSTTTSTRAPTTQPTLIVTTSTTSTTAGPECPATGCLHTMDFTNGLSGGVCGEVDDGSGVQQRTLTCGGLNIGGGMSTVAEGPTPDGSTSRFALTCAAPDSGVCAIGPTSVAPRAQSLDADCTDVGCNFGTPLPIPNHRQPNLSVCVANTWAAPPTGSINLNDGTSVTSVPLSSASFITGNLGQPCAVCRAGACDRGPNKGQPCVSNNSIGLTRDCPSGGTPVGPIAVTLAPLGTSTVSVTTPDGNFCGQGDPSRISGTIGCFGIEGDPVQPGHCRTITEHGTAGGPVTLGTPETATLAAIFCIPPTGGIVDAAADLPGPGAVTLPGTVTVQ